MATPQEILDAISEDAEAGIDSVSVAGQTVDMMSIADRMKAVEVTAAAEAVTKPHFGMRMSRIIPPGCG